MFNLHGEINFVHLLKMTREEINLYREKKIFLKKNLNFIFLIFIFFSYLFPISNLRGTLPLLGFTGTTLFSGTALAPLPFNSKALSPSLILNR